MILFREAATLHLFLEKCNYQSVGFIPTMGALHEGHISLISLCKQNAETVISSIFVNPTQFNDPADFKKYPVTLSEDILKLEHAGSDILFLPSVDEIYPKGTKATVHYDLGNLENTLEGYYRPGHFQGVCQVVHRLLDIIQPKTLYLGRKDYQQCLVLQKLINLLNLPVKIIAGPTLREPSGLAMSSRNVRLNTEQRKQAASIYHSLQNIKNNFRSVSLSRLVADTENLLIRNGFVKVDYVSIADAQTLERADDRSKEKALVALIAAFIGDVRLIDNILLTE